MAHVEFAPAIARHVACAPRTVAGASLRLALDNALGDNPTLRNYILDDQGALRKHVAIFVDGEQIRDRKQLSDPLRADAQVYVVQALSGG